AGVVMVYSASAIVAADRFQDPYLFLKKQLVWALLGAGGLLVALRIDYRRLEPLGWPVLLAAAVLLVLGLVPPLSQPINGARRPARRQAPLAASRAGLVPAGRAGQAGARDLPGRLPGSEARRDRRLSPRVAPPPGHRRCARRADPGPARPRQLPHASRGDLC